MSNTIEELVEQQQIFIQQHYRHWFEILFNWEHKNVYNMSKLSGEMIGIIEEQGSGFVHVMSRQFLGSHRPLDVTVTLTAYDDPVMSMSRSFFFFFSEMQVHSTNGEFLGTVRRRFGILSKRYDLVDREGRVFATVRSPIWRIWTFPVYNLEDREVAKITKKWKGLLKEAYTDADNFLLDFGEENWTTAQRAVILATAISIDFDFLRTTTDNNQIQSDTDQQCGPENPYRQGSGPPSVGAGKSGCKAWKKEDHKSVYRLHGSVRKSSIDSIIWTAIGAGSRRSKC